MLWNYVLIIFFNLKSKSNFSSLSNLNLKIIEMYVIKKNIVYERMKWSDCWMFCKAWIKPFWNQTHILRNTVIRSVTIFCQMINHFVDLNYSIDFRLFDCINTAIKRNLMKKLWNSFQKAVTRLLVGAFGQNHENFQQNTSFDAKFVPNQSNFYKKAIKLLFNGL